VGVYWRPAELAVSFRSFDRLVASLAVRLHPPNAPPIAPLDEPRLYLPDADRTVRRAA